ncbi:hypothetical protein RJ55_04975 [Drechmeria coniospora]|nr:hypothetical protein RJ55_04975 [Drechmeria coniospora]
MLKLLNMTTESPTARDMVRQEPRPANGPRSASFRTTPNPLRPGPINCLFRQYSVPTGSTADVACSS